MHVWVISGSRVGAVKVFGIGVRIRIVSPVCVSACRGKGPFPIGDLIDFPYRVIGVVGEILKDGFEVLEKIGPFPFALVQIVQARIIRPDIRFACVIQSDRLRNDGGINGRPGAGGSFQCTGHDADAG